MSENIQLVAPRKISRNPENPRLIFHEDELESLFKSISEQGILVPLSLYKDGRKFVLLDGERRWRCAKKLGLPDVPAIIQPKPGKMQNLMMMFAIHNARTDWDPLPTAIKLQSLENEFKNRSGRLPKESELAGIASMSRGEVRRLKKLLSLPDEYIKELMTELKKPRRTQEISVDQVLEAFKGGEALFKKNVISESEHEKLTRSLVDKFRHKVISITFDPRLLAKIARAVEREDIAKSVAIKAIRKLIKLKSYSIRDAFEDTVAQVDFEHSTEQLADRLIARLEAQKNKGHLPSSDLKAVLRKLVSYLKKQV